MKQSICNVTQKKSNVNYHNLDDPWIFVYHFDTVKIIIFCTLWMSVDRNIIEQMTYYLYYCLSLFKKNILRVKVFHLLFIYRWHIEVDWIWRVTEPVTQPKWKYWTHKLPINNRTKIIEEKVKTHAISYIQPAPVSIINEKKQHIRASK